VVKFHSLADEEVAVEEYLVPKIKSGFTRYSRNWLKMGEEHSLNITACIFNIELLLFCMFWALNFSFRIRHYLWDTLSRTADTRKPLGNAIMRTLGCSVSWKLSFSVVPRVALPLLQFVLLHSVTCVQLRLITVLGKCDCLAVASFFCVTSPLVAPKRGNP
jgi:hypothetical protein